MAEELVTREFVVAGEAGFPTPVYVGMIDFMKKKGYAVKKITDWIEISPRSAFYQDMMSKKANIEQSLGRILPAISEVRRDIELIRHDLRKLESVLKHFESKDIAVLKSDFVDLVDSHSPISMLGLANSGRFPTIVVDFYRITTAKEIEKMKVSSGEKQILRNKWQLFNEWRQRYGGEIAAKVSMLREQLQSREASLKNYREALKPYVKALHRIKVSDAGYSGLDDPFLIEGYQTSVAGVDLIMWKGVSIDKLHRYRHDTEKLREVMASGRGTLTDKEAKFDYYGVFEIQVRRATMIMREKEGEGMRLFITAKILSAEEMRKKEEEIQKQEELVERQLEEFMGTRAVEKSPQKEEKYSDDFFSFLRYKRGLSKATKEAMEKIIVQEDLKELEIRLKEIIGGLTLHEEALFQKG